MLLGEGAMLCEGARVIVNILGKEDLWSRWAIQAFHGKRGTVKERRPSDWLVEFDEPVQNYNGGPEFLAFGFDYEDLITTETP